MDVKTEFAKYLVKIGRCNSVNAVLDDQHQHNKFYIYESDWELWKAARTQAKEDSKPLAKIVKRNLSSGATEYSIIGFVGQTGYEVAIRNSEEDAIAWAKEAWYKV